uniref:ATP-dependent DNA helicase n=1 Tax=Amphimedon queenslandica TaxID=400682 RepID=A0A1X7TE82_AMPQE
MFISGDGATGKSFLLEAIKCIVDDMASKKWSNYVSYSSTNRYSRFQFWWTNNT